LLSMRSQSVPPGFPVAPCFNPICFAQGPPLVTYIVGPMIIHCSAEKNRSFRVSMRSFKWSLGWDNQNVSFHKKKLEDLGGAPRTSISITVPIQVTYLLDSFPWIVYCTICSYQLQNPDLYEPVHKVVKTQASSLLDSTINVAPVVMCKWLPPTADFVKQIWIQYSKGALLSKLFYQIRKEICGSW
jgi:hypothetical protein